MSRNTLNRWVVVLVGFGLPAYYKVKYYLLGDIGFADIFAPSGLLDVAFASSLTALVLLGHDALVPRLRARLPTHASPMQRFSVLLVGSLVASSVLVVAYTTFFFGVLYPSTVPSDFLFELLLLGAGLPLLVSGLKESLYAYGELEAEELRRRRLEHENLEARYRILQNQVDPHFLFNCLNTLDGLIEDNRARARRFVERLAGVYRFLLEHLHRDLTTVGAELEFLDAYLYLIRARFGDNLELDIRVDESLKQRTLVPMTLQITLENVLKHNVASEDAPLRVHIRNLGEDWLEIRNDRRPKSGLPSTRLGLQNLQDRYRFVAERGVQVIEDADSFAVRLPLMTMEAA